MRNVTLAILMGVAGTASVVLTEPVMVQLDQPAYNHATLYGVAVVVGLVTAAAATLWPFSIGAAMVIFLITTALGGTTQLPEHSPTRLEEVLGALVVFAPVNIGSLIGIFRHFRRRRQVS